MREKIEAGIQYLRSEGQEINAPSLTEEENYNLRAMLSFVRIDPVYWTIGVLRKAPKNPSARHISWSPETEDLFGNWIAWRSCSQREAEDAGQAPKLRLLSRPSIFCLNRLHKTSYLDALLLKNQDDEFPASVMWIQQMLLTNAMLFPDRECTFYQNYRSKVAKQAGSMLELIPTMEEAQRIGARNADLGLSEFALSV